MAKISQQSNDSWREGYGLEKCKEIKDKLSKSHSGKTFSKETRLKMSISRKGKSLSGKFNGQPKTFIFIDPDKNEYEVTGEFAKFCTNNNLPHHTFTRIIQNRRKSKFWNEWTVYKKDTQ